MCFLLRLKSCKQRGAPADATAGAAAAAADDTVMVALITATVAAAVGVAAPFVIHRCVIAAKCKHDVAPASAIELENVNLAPTSTPEQPEPSAMSGSPCRIDDTCTNPRHSRGMSANSGKPYLAMCHRLLSLRHTLGRAAVCSARQ